MDDKVLIDGVPFLPLYLHDGRFFRRPGLFAFARRQACGRRLVLHLELTDNIAGRAGPGHPRWAWALTLGMNELLVHLSGAAATATRAAVTTVLFHPDLAGTAGASDMEELLESWSGPLTGTAP